MVFAAVGLVVCGGAKWYHDREKAKDARRLERWDDVERELASKEPDWAATPSRNMGDVAVEEDKIHVEDSATKPSCTAHQTRRRPSAASTRFPKGNRRPSRPGPEAPGAVLGGAGAGGPAGGGGGRRFKRGNRAATTTAGPRPRITRLRFRTSPPQMPPPDFVRVGRT